MDGTKMISRYGRARALVPSVQSIEVDAIQKWLRTNPGPAVVLAPVARRGLLLRVSATFGTRIECVSDAFDHGIFLRATRSILPPNDTAARTFIKGTTRIALSVSSYLIVTGRKAILPEQFSGATLFMLPCHIAVAHGVCSTVGQLFERALGRCLHSIWL